MARCEISDIVLTKQGKPKPEAPVTIKVVAGAAGSATMYTSETGSGTVSALATDEDGFFSVWMEEGRYEVHGGAVVKTVENINQASVAVGSIGAEAITAEKLHSEAVETAKIKNLAVTSGKLATAVQEEIKAGAAGKEESLGEKEGTVKLDVSKASVFKVTVKGATEFEVTNAPATPKEIVLIVTQDNAGAHTWSIKGVSWINTTPTFLTTAKLAYLVPMLVLSSGAEILGEGGIEAIGAEAVTTEKIAAKAVTGAKIEKEAVKTEQLGAEAVTGAKILKETIGTSKIENKSINRAKFLAEISKLIPLERGRTTEVSGATETTITAPNTATGVCIIISLEGTGTAVACEIKERKAGESFVVKFASAFTGFVNWVVYE